MAIRVRAPIPKSAPPASKASETPPVSGSIEDALVEADGDVLADEVAVGLDVELAVELAEELAVELAVELAEDVDVIS